MTFLRVLVLALAVGAPGIAHMAVLKVCPGFASYRVLRLSISAFIGAEFLCGAGVIVVASMYDDQIVRVAPIVYLVALAYVLMGDWAHVEYHFAFKRCFPSPDELVRCTMAETVDHIWRYANHYGKVSVWATASFLQVQLKVGGKTVASITLSDRTSIELFTQLGIRFLGWYDWPTRVDEVSHVTVKYLGNETWELDDGSGPRVLKRRNLSDED